jgi:hypothetical protein
LGSQLPRIDQPGVAIAADPDTVWLALLDHLWRSTAPSLATRAGAAAIGCRERAVSGPPGRRGSTIVGFAVQRSEPPALLALVGAHRFSRYALTFAIEPLGDGGSSLSATTDAAFPGPHGRAYRALVIGSGAHRRLMHAMLARIQRDAERWAGAL